MLKQLFSRFQDVKIKQVSGFCVVLVVAAAGTYLLVNGHAATPYVSINADKGTLAGGATSQTCSGAADGRCVKLGQYIPMDGSVALALMSPGTPFAASSFWNALLPDSTPVNVNTPAYLNSIAYNLCRDATAVPDTPPPACPTSTYYGYLNYSAYSAPLYIVPANQPLVPITLTRDVGVSGDKSFNDSVSGGVPIPVDAHGAAGTDAEVEIYQPSTNKYWDFWHFRKDVHGNWDADWGGGMTNVSGSNGLWSNHLGADATSLPLIGADPRIDELQAGQINHVIGLTIGDDASANLGNYPLYNLPPANTPGAAHSFSWPATRSDGDSTNPLAVPEGQRFRLPANLDLGQYDLTLVAKVIAVAAQKYGFVVNDSCPQACITIRIGDPTAYTAAGLPNPYTSGPGVGGVGNSGLYQGLNPTLIMKNFPWDKLQALPFNYGKPATP